MPEAYTHVRIARAAREQLRQSGADAADTAAYELGANGPDPLFCYHVLSKKPYPMAALGERMHTQQCGRFLRALIFRAYSPAQRSYVLGFLTHYAADSTMHPYIAALTAENGPFARREGHGLAEVALDTYFHEADGLGRAVAADDCVPVAEPGALADITALLHAALLEVYGEEVPAEYLADAFHDLRWYHRYIFPSPHGGKKAVVWLAERLLLHRPGYGLSHMTPARQPKEGYPAQWTDPYTGLAMEAGPDELCRASAEKAAHYQKAACAYWQGAVSKDDVAIAIGDKSYATGLVSEAEAAAPPSV